MTPQSKTVTDIRSTPSSINSNTSTAQQSLHHYLNRLFQRFHSTTNLIGIYITDTDGYIIASTLPSASSATTTKQQKQGQSQRGGNVQQQQAQRGNKASTATAASSKSTPSSLIESYLHMIPITCQQASKCSIGLSNTLTLRYSQYTLIIHNLIPIYVVFLVSNQSDHNSTSSLTHMNNIAQLSNTSIYRSLCHELQPLRASVQLERDRQSLHSKTVT